MKIALLTTDNREHHRDYAAEAPRFGAAPEALLQGFATQPELEVHVISCAQQPLKSPARLAANVFFHSLHVPQWGWLRTGYQGCLRAVREQLRHLQPDLVHGQGTERDCALSAVFSGRPNVVTIHGNMAELARLFRARPGSFYWLAARLENFTLRRAGGVLCNSEYTQTLAQLRAQRTWRVPNALREPFFVSAPQPGNRERCRLLNIGVISPRKRQVELLRLAGDLHRRGVACEWRFIGDVDASDAYGAAFMSEVRRAEEHGYALYLGKRSVAGLIQELDRAAAVVHFPNEEAFGLVVAEALARNVNLFGANLGGIKDIATGVPGAELFAPEDWEGLGRALAQWIQCGYPAVSGASAVMAQHYHPRVVAARHLEIYRELLRRPA